MDWFKDWILAVCSASVFCAVINLLVSDERFEKTIKICTAVFMLFVVISPLTEITSCNSELIKIEEKESDYEFEDRVLSQMEEYASSAAENVIKQRLEEKGISIREISVSMDSLEKGCISIGHVTVDVQAPCLYDSDVVKTLLEDWFPAEEVEVRGI